MFLNFKFYENRKKSRHFKTYLSEFPSESFSMNIDSSLDINEITLSILNIYISYFLQTFQLQQGRGHPLIVLAFFRFSFFVVPLTYNICIFFFFFCSVNYIICFFFCANGESYNFSFVHMDTDACVICNKYDKS